MLAALGAAYPKGRCFADFTGFLASNIVEFVRLIKDAAITRIELTNDITFTEDLFPPDHANNQSLGINVTHAVTIRACTGDASQPIIVDVNNLQQQIYVYGEMRWEGNIKFVNSFPSPRRAGLFPLISVLSVEQDGIIGFKDLQIHGNEPCPLFNLNDPFWDRYGNSPLSPQFVPQQGDFELRSQYEVLLLHWKFNKTAWVTNSQGPHGVVKAVGDAYWLWEDVLVTWSKAAGGGAKGGALAAAIAVPVVVAALLAAAAIGFVLWRRRRAQAAAAAGESKDFFPTADPSLQPGGIGAHSVNGMPPASTTYDGSTSKLESSKYSYNTHELIEEARRRMQVTVGGRRDTAIVLEGLLGEGTFGKVYKGTWQGTVVAVKTMLFPAAMSGKEKREKMAIMETAISSTLSHPNIVQTYTYVVKPLTGELAMQAIERSKGGAPQHGSDDTDPSSLLGSELGENHGWEVRLVLELCDLGSLKELLNAGGLRRPDGSPDMVGVVATALDIARAMLHLHSENIIHSDLKCRNVLLKSAGSDARGFVAKVSDFGLSVRMDPSETHVSNVYQGTLTHMAPEVLMFGKISRASDVYAFGVLLWELYTAQQAFKGMPKALLGHEVTKMGQRPEFPPDSPFDYQLLACRCWESDPAIRPSRRLGLLR
ncbi:hypothetical protein OEZ85_007699 [Tetradesmus obliquus]|uniref:Protein kinase domain-containing protein n=1 Tax=Tetradesmus obliquus TaxID=3088 RepID=A0ABY8TGZ4_TETOB|nr:hypothetical protein OEZ85_007699 [Tetradesmus obliquus]